MPATLASFWYSLSQHTASDAQAPCLHCNAMQRPKLGSYFHLKVKPVVSFFLRQGLM